MKGTTVYLTEEERRLLNIMAGENGSSLNELMANAIREKYSEDFDRLRGLFARGILRSSEKVSDLASKKQVPA